MFITILLNLFRVLRYKNKLGGQFKNWRDLPTVPGRLDETLFIVGQISVLEKQYKGSVSQKNMIYFSAFDDQMAVRK